MLKTLGKQIKQFKLASILTPFFMFMEVLTETIIPLLMASMIDNGVNKGNMNHILTIPIVRRKVNGESVRIQLPAVQG